MKASELAAKLGGVLEGEDVDVLACGGLEEARKGDLSFCKDTKHVALVQATKASAVLITYNICYLAKTNKLNFWHFHINFTVNHFGQSCCCITCTNIT